MELNKILECMLWNAISSIPFLRNSIKPLAVFLYSIRFLIVYLWDSIRSLIVFLWNSIRPLIVFLWNSKRSLTVFMEFNKILDCKFYGIQ